MDKTLWSWLGFGIVLATLVTADLLVFQRRKRPVSFREAMVYSLAWVGFALLFGLGIWAFRGPADALAFYTGFVVEKALSLDNIFVFVMIFNALAVPPQPQRRALSCGILVALVLRGLFIAAGVALVHRFNWVLTVFGALLVVAAIRMALPEKEPADPSAEPIVRFCQRFIPVVHEYDDDRLFVRRGGRRLGTPLLIALLAIGGADVMFALDSIPAIFAVTQDPFLVCTSNAFAVLGMTGLYFLLAGVVDKFRYLKFGLAVVLTLVGIKLCLANIVEIPTGLSLVVILGIVCASILASILHREPNPAKKPKALPRT